MKCSAIITIVLVVFVAFASSAEVTVAEWQHKAVAKYPELAQQGSDLNTRFIAEVAKRKVKTPLFFDKADWPMRLADELTSPPVIPGLDTALAAKDGASGRLRLSVRVEKPLRTDGSSNQVLLFPETFSFKRKWAVTQLISASILLKEPDVANCFYTDTDVNGTAIINNIPPGKYTLIIQTSIVNNTKAGGELSRHILSKFLTPEGIGILAVFKVRSNEIQILPNEETKASIVIEN